MKIRKILAALLAACVILGACQAEQITPSPSPTPSAVEPTPTPTPEPTPALGGSMTIAMRMPETLNPLLNRDASVAEALKLMFEPLVILGEDLKPIPNPVLVRSIDVSADGLSMILRLKSGITWSDGAAITADDVVFSLYTLREAPENAYYKQVVYNLDSYSAMDAENVRISFKQPFGAFMYLFMFPVIAKHYYKNNADSDLKPFGNGAYEFESFTAVRELVLKASDRALGGKPYIETVRCLFTPDSASDLFAFEQSRMDVLNSNISVWSRFSDQRPINMTTYAGTYFDCVGFNFKKPLFEDKNVRAAIAMLLPTDEIISTVYSNYAVRAETPISPQSWLYKPTENYAFNIESAKGMITYGTEVTLLVNDENIERKKIAQMLNENMTAAGFRVTLVEKPFEDFRAAMEAGEYDVAVCGFNMSLVPDLTFMLHSKTEDTDGNLFGYADEQMDALLAVAFSAVSDEAYKAAIGDIQDYIAAELPVIGIAYRNNVLLTGKAIYGDIKPAADNIYRNITEWFVP